MCYRSPTYKALQIHVHDQEMSVRAFFLEVRIVSDEFLKNNSGIFIF